MYESDYVTASSGKTNITDADKPKIRVVSRDSEFEESIKSGSEFCIQIVADGKCADRQYPGYEFPVCVFVIRMNMPLLGEFYDSEPEPLRFVPLRVVTSGLEETVRQKNELRKIRRQALLEAIGNALGIEHFVFTPVVSEFFAIVKIDEGKKVTK